MGASSAPAPLGLSSKEIILSSWGNGAPEMAITVQGNWAYTTTKGPDFDIHRLTADINGVFVTVYVGHHPRDVVSINATTVKVKVRTRPVIFYVTQREGSASAEAVMDGFFSGFEGPGVGELKLHIMAGAESPELLATVFTAIATLHPITKQAAR